MSNVEIQIVSELVNRINEELKNCTLNYFDILEISVGQTDGTELAKHFELHDGWLVGGLESHLVFACREVCKQTLDATDELRRRLAAGEYVDLEDVYEDID